MSCLLIEGTIKAIFYFEVEFVTSKCGIEGGEWLLMQEWTVP